MLFDKATMRQESCQSDEQMRPVSTAQVLPYSALCWLSNETRRAIRDENLFNYHRKVSISRTKSTKMPWSWTGTRITKTDEWTRDQERAPAEHSQRGAALAGGRHSHASMHKSLQSVQANDNAIQCQMDELSARACNDHEQGNNGII